MVLSVWRTSYPVEGTASLTLKDPMARMLAWMCQGFMISTLGWFLMYCTRLGFQAVKATLAQRSHTTGNKKSCCESNDEL